MTITNAGLTAALVPVREELDRLEREAKRQVDSYEIDTDECQGRLDTIERVRSVLDRIHPEPDTLAALGMVAIGMLREFRDTSVVVTRESVDDWNKRADELLAAADPQTKEGPDRH